MRVRMPVKVPMRVMVGLALGLTGLAGPARAVDLAFAGPVRVTQQSTSVQDSYDMPVGPFGGDGVATRHLEGRLAETSYQLDAPGATTLEILAPLRDQIAAAGYKTVFECAADVCGGYDFRYAMRVVAEPAMHVDLADYRYLAAERMGPAGPEAISLLVSRSALAGFVQVIEVGAAAKIPAAVATPTVIVPTAPVAPLVHDTPDGMAETLVAQGFVVLEDVVFDSGASVLGAGEIASLAELAAWLEADATRVVALVGHTDASGGLAANVALGAKRAQAIRTRLIGALGVPAGQVSAEGAGYLAPRASNMTEEGRRLNRRVEVILLPPPAP